MVHTTAASITNSSTWDGKNTTQRTKQNKSGIKYQLKNTPGVKKKRPLTSPHQPDKTIFHNTTRYDSVFFNTIVCTR